jgi:hypothetical protein
MPKLNYYRKKEEPSPLECVEGEKSRKKVLEAVRAIEMHMALSCIAMGFTGFLVVQTFYSQVLLKYNLNSQHNFITCLNVSSYNILHK